MARTPDEGLEFLGGRKRLSLQEKSFMELIWKHEEGILSEDIYSHFPMARGTVSAVLAHIVEKRYAAFQKVNRHSIYKALVTKREYEKALMKQKMKDCFGTGSMAALVGMFCGREELTHEEAEEVKRLLEKFEK